MYVNFFKRRTLLPPRPPKLGVGLIRLISAAIWPDFVPVISGFHSSTAENLAHKYVMINYHKIFVVHRQNLW